MDVAGKRVLIMGLGRHGGGVAAARFMAERGANVIVTDLAKTGELRESLERLRDLRGVRYRLGTHVEDDFLRAEIVVVNPAVRPGNTLVELARARGAAITSEIELALEHCPARMIGVTGTVGKSTTAAMIAHVLRASGRRAWLGGNIEHSLLCDLGRMTRDDWAVIELSSFQLWWLSPRARLPQIAVVTNCSPNHLDWHASYGDYVGAKRRLCESGPRDRQVVLNMADNESATWRGSVRAQVIEVHGAEDLERYAGKSVRLLLPGAHNRGNAALAAAAARATGCTVRDIEAGLASFRSLPHRLEFVGEIDARWFFNDSKATTPAAAAAALRAFEPQAAWLLAGGHDKGMDFRELIATIERHARGAAFFGAAGAQLFELASRCGVSTDRACRVTTMDEALEWCWRRSQRGDAIVLSPACASFDQFRDYADRGTAFVELVHRMAGAAPAATVA